MRAGPDFPRPGQPRGDIMEVNKTAVSTMIGEAQRWVP